MKIYCGIDMAKDKFDYCIADSENILTRGNNCENTTEEFERLIGVLKGFGDRFTPIIGMESTGIYHIPLYSYLTSKGFGVRILNGLEVRGMKKSRIRKNSNDSMDAESIAVYLMHPNRKETYEFPEEMKNLKELVTALEIITEKVRTAKNNVNRVLEMTFRELSNKVEISDRTTEMLMRFRTPEEFLAARDEDLIKYISRKKIRSIKEAAKHSPPPGSNREALLIELSSLLRILTVLTGERKKMEDSLSKALDTKNHVIATIPGIGTITASIIIGKVGDIRRFETARKLVAFAGIEPVIKESGKMRLEKSISKRGDPILRSALYLSAVGATRSNPVIRDFYQRKVREGMPKQKAIVAASRKMCHIVWSVWYNNKPFEVPERLKTR